MTLYEINEALLRCIKVDEDLFVDGETGEVIDTAAIDELHMAKDEKVLNIARWIKNLSAEAEAIKNEKQKLAKRQAACETKAESLKNYLASALTEGETYKDATARVSWRKSEVADVDVLRLMASDYKDKYVTFEPKVNKSDIKAALKKGEEIPGCALVVKQNIQIG